MTGLQTVRLIAGREIRVRRKAFLITTGLLLAVTAIGIVAVIWATEEDAAPISVLVVGEVPPALEERIALWIDGDDEIEVGQADAETARAAVESGEADLAIMTATEVLRGPGSDRLAVDAVVSILGQDAAIEIGRAAGLDADEVRRMLEPAVEVTSTEPEPEPTDVGNEVVAAIGVVIMFIGILSYGQWIAYGVIEEKANRVVELILGTVRAEHLMAAKVISIGSLGLAQLVMVGLVLGGTAVATDRLVLPPATASALAWVTLWFILGYALYGTVYAASGALVRSVQDAGGAVGPINMLVGIGYMVGLISVSGGQQNVLMQVLSLIPVWSPLLMPARIVRGWAGQWEIVLSLGAMLVSTYIVMKVAAWAYRGGLSRSTSKLGWREAVVTGRDLGRAGRG